MLLFFFHFTQGLLIILTPGQSLPFLLIFLERLSPCFSFFGLSGQSHTSSRGQEKVRKVFPFLPLLLCAGRSPTRLRHQSEFSRKQAFPKILFYLLNLVICLPPDHKSHSCGMPDRTQIFLMLYCLPPASFLLFSPFIPFSNAYSHGLFR